MAEILKGYLDGVNIKSFTSHRMRPSAQFPLNWRNVAETVSNRWVVPNVPMN